MGKYIKVATKDGKSSVVLASNEAFYKSLSAKIEVPSEKEIHSFFPEEKVLSTEKKELEVLTFKLDGTIKSYKDELNKNSELTSKLNEVLVERDGLQQQIGELNSTISELNLECNNLSKELNALKTELDNLKPKK